MEANKLENRNVIFTTVIVQLVKIKIDQVYNI